MPCQISPYLQFPNPDVNHVRSTLSIAHSFPAFFAVLCFPLLPTVRPLCELTRHTRNQSVALKKILIMRKFAFYAATAASIITLLVTQTTQAQNTSPYWSLAGNSNTSTASKLGTTNGVSLRFYTNNAQRMLIGFSSGNVSIGSTSLNARLTVNAASGSDILLGQANGTTKFYAASNGGFTVGASATPPANGLHVSGNTGFGTNVPENKVHIVKGSAGSVTGYANAPLLVENSTSSYINVLAPEAEETGILFGKPSNNVSGGIIYSNASTSNGLQFRTNGNTTRMVLTAGGNLGIGTFTPTHKLSVNGTVQSKEVRVETGWADYVFEKGYTLRPLAEVAAYIEAHKHLPGIPSASEVRAEGLAIGEMQTKMMEKIEELTLYIIDLQKQIAELKAEKK